MLLQFQNFPDSNGISGVFWSGFNLHQTKETVLLKFSNNLLTFIDSGDHAILILLDLNAAFDIVAYSVLASQLGALNWHQRPSCGVLKIIPIEQKVFFS